MSLNVLSQPLVDEGVGADDLELSLTKYAGEVLTAFRRETVTNGLFMTKRLTRSKSAQFPVMGRTSVQTHTAGESIFTDTGPAGSAYLKNTARSEVIIGLDRPLLGAEAMDEFEEAVAHFEQRSEISFQQGEALARAVDRRRLIALALSATNGTPNLAELPSGYNPTAIANLTTDIDTFTGALRDAKTAYDNRYVSKRGRFAIVDPETFNWLADEGADRYLHKDYLGAEGNGDAINGEIMMVQGWKIMSSTNLPTGTIAADEFGSARNTYTGTFGNVKVLLGTSESVGVVTLGGYGFRFNSEWSTEYQAHVLVSKMVQGCAPRRPETAGILIEQ